MLDHNRQILASSDNPNWCTPLQCFNALAREFAFTIDLAADLKSCLVHRSYTDGDVRTVQPSYFGPDRPAVDDRNALTAPWTNYLGFLNPPYSRQLANAYRTGRVKPKGSMGYVEHPKDPELAKSFEIEHWAHKCWWESFHHGATVVGLFPFAPQTDWYQRYVYGIGTEITDGSEWLEHAAMEERRLSHRISFTHPDGLKSANANVNSVVIIWRPNPGYVGCWQPAQRYWSYR